MDKLTGKVALVTGASAGIGAATARTLAARGAKVAVVARRPAQSMEVVGQILDAGGEATFVQADVSVADQVWRMVDRVVEWGGRLDIAVNNAGIGGPNRAVADVDDAGWDSVLATNLTGVFHCMRAEITAMRTGGGGAIVNVLSAVVCRPVRHTGAYAASKRGALALTETAALEEIGNGIRINAVSLGGTLTPMAVELMRTDPELAEAMSALHPIGRLAEPEEHAAVIAFLCGPDASFLAGATVASDGAAGIGP
ncbi:SDR family oxidoreductase [Herbidospora sp. NEAU-GS84]|uniref:SDR family oxidoreductase n=1 Tax=Herbidospora solisilvae TaxID=2696284 RepID=A0A7C9N675_9ACTN|nr:SDR family oxidoreductase [Herbidospora solisilvae]NAS25954.1 SDR family oxidoreductase [Herbidospora solisilvae]